MGTVNSDVRDGILVLTINRPETRNAIDLSMAQAIDEALRRLDDDPTLSVGILTGANGIFSAGMDLKYYMASGRTPTIEGRGFAGLTRAVVRKPLIAAVEGYALGGGFEMALACDLIVAAESARFGLPEPSRGLIPAEGGVIRLPRRLPYHIAMEILLTGEPLTAPRAAAFGLVNRLVPADSRTLDIALELARSVQRNAPLALAAIKEVTRMAVGESHVFAVQDPIAHRLAESADVQEGVRAFVARRDPIWTGR